MKQNMEVGASQRGDSTLQPPADSGPFSSCPRTLQSTPLHRGLLSFWPIPACFPLDSNNSGLLDSTSPPSTAPTSLQLGSTIIEERTLPSLSTQLVPIAELTWQVLKSSRSSYCLLLWSWKEKHLKNTNFKKQNVDSKSNDRFLNNIAPSFHLFNVGSRFMCAPGQMRIL